MYLGLRLGFGSVSVSDSESGHVFVSDLEAMDWALVPICGALRSPVTEPATQWMRTGPLPQRHGHAAGDCSIRILYFRTHYGVRIR